jgi:hypothetical protein
MGGDADVHFNWPKRPQQQQRAGSGMRSTSLKSGKVGMPVHVFGRVLETSARPIQTHNGAGFAALFATRFVAIRREGVSRSKSSGACEPTGRAAAPLVRPHVFPTDSRRDEGGAPRNLHNPRCDSTSAMQQGSRMSSGLFDGRRNSVGIAGANDG